jgi:APA family basic amino acid/polyamine antiporter
MAYRLSPENESRDKRYAISDQRGEAAEAPRHPRDQLERSLSVADATLLVVASVIGVGIFLTPGTIAEILPHPGLILAVWVIGGLLSLAGALANAELGAMYPHAGGDYVYVREAFHPAAGFVVGWLSFFVIYSGTVATLAVGFAEGMARFMPLAPWQHTGVAVLVTIAASAVNYAGVRAGARVNNVTSGAKIIALLALALAGIVLGGMHGLGLLAAIVEAPPVSWSAFGLALSPVLFSYLGWNAPVYVASEVHDPGRSIPLALFIGLLLCTAIYVLVNVAYLAALPLDEIRGEVRVGEMAAGALFGSIGGALAAALILLSIASCLNATILVGPRIAYAMALDGLFPAAIARVHPMRRTPHVAILAQAATAIALIVVLARFPSVLDYTTFAIVLATIADTLALYALRYRRPGRPRPYRAWGYPFVPALYLMANSAIAVAMLRGRPWECGIALAVAATGIPAYLWFAGGGKLRVES